MPTVPDPNAQALADQLNIMSKRITSIERGLQTGQLGNSSLGPGEWLAMYDPDGTLRGRVGAHPDGSYGVTLPNNFVPPPVPNTPLVEGVLGGLRVTATGSSAQFDRMPVDFSHFNVYVAKENENGAIMDKITSDKAATVIAPLDYVNYRVWLTGENLTGTESPPSGESVAMPQKAVADDITDGIVTELKIAEGAVTAAKIAAGAVGEVQLGDKVVDVTKLADGSVTGEIIAANAIAAGNIAANAIQTNHIAAGAVAAINIAAGAIAADKIAAQAITADKIAANAITADKIAANAITATKIDAGAISAEKIQAGIIISDATLQTGYAGRRVVVSGPGNDIRFYPQVGETRFARMFTYVPEDLPNDIAVELRAIDSDDADVISRLYLNPNRCFLGMTNSDDTTLSGGGAVELKNDQAFFGIKIPTEAVAVASITCTTEAQFQVIGGFGTGWFGPDQAIGIDFLSNDAGFGGVNFSFPDTMLTPMLPIINITAPQSGPNFSWWLSTVTTTGFVGRWSDANAHDFYAWVARILPEL